MSAGAAEVKDRLRSPRTPGAPGGSLVRFLSAGVHLLAASPDDGASFPGLSVQESELFVTSRCCSFPPDRLHDVESLFTLGDRNKAGVPFPPLRSARLNTAATVLKAIFNAATWCTKLLPLQTGR